MNESVRKRFLEAYQLPAGVEKALRLGELAAEMAQAGDVDIRVIAKATEISTAAALHRHTHVVLAGEELLSILGQEGNTGIGAGSRLTALSSLRAVLGSAIELVDLPFEHADALLAAFREQLERDGHPLGGYWQRVAQRAARGHDGRLGADLLLRLRALARGAEPDGIADCQRCTLVDIVGYLDGFAADEEREELLRLAVGSSQGCDNSRIHASVSYSRFCCNRGDHDRALEQLETGERLVAALGARGASWILPVVARLELSTATSDFDRMSAGIEALVERIETGERTYAEWEALLAMWRACRVLANAGRNVPVDSSVVERQASLLASCCDDRAGVERYQRQLLG